MSIVKCTDPKTGVVYVYSSEPYYDENNKRRYKRKCIGRVGEDGKVVPTGQKGGYRPTRPKAASEDSVPRKRGRKPKKEPTPENAAILKQLNEQKARNLELDKQILTLKKEVGRLQGIIDRAKRQLENAASGE